MATTRAEAAASKIKDRIIANLELVAARDREFLSDVCTALEITPSPVNISHVMTLLHDAGVVTHQEYPKMLYPQGPGRPGVLVNNAQEEKAQRVPAQGQVKDK